MRMVVAIVLAYLIAAICYVWRDLAERNIVRQKPYVWKYRETGSLSILIGAGMGWIVGVLGNAHMRGRFTTYEFPPIAAFIGSAVFFWIISN